MIPIKVYILNFDFLEGFESPDLTIFLKGGRGRGNYISLYSKVTVLIKCQEVYSYYNT